MAVDQESAALEKLKNQAEMISAAYARDRSEGAFALKRTVSAYAAEERRAERERCVAIVRRHVKAGKVDRVDWLREQIAGKIELEEG